MDWKKRFEEPKIGDQVRVLKFIHSDYQSGIGTIIWIVPSNLFDYQVRWKDGKTSYVKKNNIEVVA